MRGWLILLTMMAASLAAVAQSSSYSFGHAWWEPDQDEHFPWDADFDNTAGLLRIASPAGSFRTGGHPFFTALGANGRACVTCHQPSNAMSLSVDNIRKRWVDTKGKDPLFATVDGANCPTLPQGKRASHSLLLDRGLFRIGLAWPPKNVRPDFRIEVLSDPTGCNPAGLAAGQISVYRRPRMSANLSRLVEGPNGPVLMADGRAATLRDQAIDAALVHEQAGATPTEEQLRRILDFETQVTAVQHSDLRGGFTADFNTPAPGTIGKHRDSVRRGSELFASRCASCHQPGTTRWKAISPQQPQAALLPDLPVFRVTCDSGRVVTTQDPGRALISGRCEDVGAIVIPQFHGLAARPPYFSNGSAATLDALVDSYRERLDIRFRPEEKQDLVNYLLSL